MATTESSREARRRKILERGSQRLGLITGRIQDIPSPPPSSPPSISHLQLSSQPSDQFNNSLLSSSLDAEDKAVRFIISDQNIVSDAGQTISENGGSAVGSSLKEIETSVSEASNQRRSSTVASDPVSVAAGPVSIPSSLGSSSASEQSAVRDISFKRVFFTPNQINAAITATEKTRLICSATVAFLVVLSCLGLPLLGSYIIKGVIAFRPLYLVLLTNITVVLAQLLFGNQKHPERASKVQNSIPTIDEYGWADQVSKLLEAAILLQKVLDAVFMDCSVYALIVICGLAFAW